MVSQENAKISDKETMKRFTIFILLMVGLLNISIPIDANDAGGGRSNQEFVGHADCPGQSADHSSTADASCHQCHFGHCSFLSPVATVVSPLDLSSNHTSFNSDLNLPFVLFGLFRPPII